MNRFALIILACAALGAIPISCGQQNSQVKPSATTLSPQAEARMECATTLAAMLDEAVNTGVNVPAAFDQILYRFTMEYGSQSEIMRSFLSIYPSVIQSARSVGIQRATNDAAALIEVKCSEIHPEPTTTSTQSSTTTTAATPGTSVGTATAPDQLDGRCLSGEIRGGLALVECAVGAWRTGLLETYDNRISSSARAALRGTPPPSTIAPLGCFELSSRTESGPWAGNTSIADVECRYRLSDGRVVRFKLIDAGGSDGQSISAIAFDNN